MKRLFKSFLIVIMMFVIYPMVSNADINPLKFEGYAKQGSIGSELVFLIRGYNSFDGTIKYNSDELEFVSIDDDYPTFIEGISIEKGKIDIISNDSGKIVFKYKVAASEIKDILVTFKVKKIPDDKIIKITYVPNDLSTIYDQESITLDYRVVPSSGVVEINDNSECPKQETKTETIEKTSTLTYVLGASTGALLIALLIIIFKKKVCK